MPENVVFRLMKPVQEVCSAHAAPSLASGMCKDHNCVGIC
jgi:hypothetical protein